MNKGLFITFDGIDGSGKSTQVALLATWLKGQGCKVRVTREPGGTALGEAIRELILKKDYSLDSYTQLFLFLADRAQHLQEVIRPALDLGYWVISDRFVDATIAYQGYGYGIDIGFIEEIHKKLLGDTWPDVTVILDCSPQVARMRLLRRYESNRTESELESEKDRFENLPLDFQRRLREGFAVLVKKDPDRLALVNAEEEAESVHKQILSVLEEKGLWRFVTS